MTSKNRAGKRMDPCLTPHSRGNAGDTCCLRRTELLQSVYQLRSRRHVLETHSFFYLECPKMCIRTFSSIVCNLFHVMLQYFCHWLNGVHFNRIFMAKLQYYPFQYLKCHN